MTFVILVRIPSGKYLLLVDRAHPVAPLVRVQGARPVRSGALYFVDVKEQTASELDTLFPWLHPHSSFVPAGDIVAPCSSAAQADEAALQEMAFSQRVAAAVALRKLHYHVVVKPTGVVVSQLIGGTHAPCNLQPMDVVVAVDGTPTPTEASLHAALGRVTPGAVVKLRLRRDGKLLTVPIRTVEDRATGRALVGFVPNQAATFKLPLRVAIDSNGIGGPSAGLAFTLEVMQQLGRNVLHGHRVAATGEMELNGAVGRSEASSRRRTACGRPAPTSSSCPRVRTRGTRAATPGRFTSSRSAHSTRRCTTWQRCRLRRRNRSFPPARNCRKFVSFRPRQRLLARLLRLSSHLESGPYFLEQRPK